MPFYYEFWREYNAIYERPGEGFISFNGNKLSNCIGEKSTMTISGVCIFREQARKLKLKCRSRSPSNLKLSIKKHN